MIYIKQISNNCPDEAGYYIESNGYAAIIDPSADTALYLQIAKQRGARIVYILETQFRPGLASGQKDLANDTGAHTIYGPTGVKTGLDVVIGRDGQEFKLGKALIRLMHTHGLSGERSCFLLIDEEKKEVAMFTGDALFQDRVGIPYQATQTHAEQTTENRSPNFFDALRNEAKPLSEDLIGYSVYGAETTRERNIGKQANDACFDQRKNNYAIGSATKISKRFNFNTLIS